MLFFLNFSLSKNFNEIEIETKICHFCIPLNFKYEKKNLFSIRNYIFPYDRKVFLHKFLNDFDFMKNIFNESKMRNLKILNKKIKNIFSLKNQSSDYIQYNYQFNKYNENIANKVLNLFFILKDEIFLSTMDFFYAFNSTINFFNAAYNLHNYFSHISKVKISILSSQNMHEEYEKNFQAYIKAIKIFCYDWIKFYNNVNRYLCDKSIDNFTRVLEEAI